MLKYSIVMPRFGNENDGKSCIETRVFNGTASLDGWRKPARGGFEYADARISSKTFRDGSHECDIIYSYVPLDWDCSRDGKSVRKHEAQLK